MASGTLRPPSTAMPSSFLCDPGRRCSTSCATELALTGSKEGCGSGDCGACSVMLDGRWSAPAWCWAPRPKGRDIETIEGMADGDKGLHPCSVIPGAGGAAMRHLHAGLPGRRQGAAGPQPGPERDEIRYWLAGNLCRCTGYDKIVRAVLVRRRRDEGGLIMPLDTDAPVANRVIPKFRQVGTRPVRPDGVDKVTGRAKFGADLKLPGMLIGRVLRSPHPHARIRAIDTSKAEALEGVKAVVTRADFPDIKSDEIVHGEADESLHDIVVNVMARDKALYEGHAVAAVAATSATVARKALALIEVDYEPLPHVTDVDAAMRPDAPILHEDMFTSGMEPKPDKPSNVARTYMEVGLGDVDRGFRRGRCGRRARLQDRGRPPGLYRAAGLSRQRIPRTVRPSSGAAPRATTSCATPAPRSARHRHLQARVTASEIGGGFGGKTTVFVEPVALGAVAQGGAAGQAGDEPRRGVPGDRPDLEHLHVGQDRRHQGRPHHRRRGGAEVPGRRLFRARRWSGAPCRPSPATTCSPREGARLRRGHQPAQGRGLSRARLAHVRLRGGKRGRRAGCGARSAWIPSSCASRTPPGRAPRPPTAPPSGPTAWSPTLQAAKVHDHYRAPLGPNQGRGVASGFWFNFGGETCVSLNVAKDGTVTLSIGTPDIGGTRAAQCQIAAEELGIRLRPGEGHRRRYLGARLQRHHRRQPGRLRQSAWRRSRRRAPPSRSAAAGPPRSGASRPDAVVWEDGAARPASPNAGDFDPMTPGRIWPRWRPRPAAPSPAIRRSTPRARASAFGTHIADVEVDEETGRVSVTRYTVIQDAGKAIHPGYVEGQYQGGAVQGIGWALNEEYVYGEDGRCRTRASSTTGSRSPRTCR